MAQPKIKKFTAEDFPDEPTLTAKRKRAIKENRKDRAHRASEKRLKKIKNPSVNRLIALPGELRNQIYQHVFGPPMQLSAHTLFPSDYWFNLIDAEYEYIAGCVDTVKEPSLLLTSKFFREEAGPIFYHEHYIIVHTRAAELEQACSWIARMLERSGSEPNLNFRLHITSAPWKDIPFWFNLAFLIYNTDLGTYTENDLVQEWSEKIAIPYEADTNVSRVRKALLELVELAVSAKFKRNSRRDLSMLFRGWAATITEHPKYVLYVGSRDQAALALRKAAMTPPVLAEFLRRQEREKTAKEEQLKKEVRQQVQQEVRAFQDRFWIFD